MELKPVTKSPRARSLSTLDCLAAATLYVGFVGMACFKFSSISSTGDAGQHHKDTKKLRRGSVVTPAKASSLEGLTLPKVQDSK